MRVTDSLTTNSLLQNIESSLGNLNSVQQQISTGKKLNTPSDDPAGASQALAWRASLVDNAQYQRDADQAKSFLSASDSALSSVSDAIRSARQIAVQGANSTQSSDSLSGLATQVDGLIQQVTKLANSDMNGKYLFSGTQTNTAPFSASDPTHAYQGDGGSVVATLGPNDQMTLNTPGNALFGGVFATLETLKSDLNNTASGTAGAVTAVSNDLAGLDTSLSTISTARATIGAKVNQTDAATQRLTRAQGEYEQALSNVEDTDLAQAYVQLQSAQNVYQASLVTTARAYQHSLSDYL